MIKKKSIIELQRKEVVAFRRAKKRPLVVVLDNIRSQHNVGAAFRLSDAFLVEQIYLCGITPVPPSPLIHKTALGAEESVAWKHVGETTSAIKDLKEQGYTILAVEQAHGAQSLADWTFNAPYAFIFGNEVFGVSDEVLNLVDGCLEIKQAGTKHSLNVSTCMAITIWEAMRHLQG